MRNMAASSWILTIGILLAQQPAATTQPPAKSQKAVEGFRKEAAEYVVRLNSRPSETLALEKEAALRWDNPARTGEDGALFIWTLGDRPQMLGTIFTYRYKETLSRKHEFHSLAEGPLTAEFRGKLAWAPAKAGVTFQPVSGAQAPAANSRQRLSQMKAMARDFNVGMTEADGQHYQLRLLSQPLIRYEPQDKPVQDGALFSFSLGTDPEAILLLEARAVKDVYQWQYAFARMHYIELKAEHLGKSVWHVPALPDILNLDVGATAYRDSVYTTYHVERNIAIPE
jgi:hypothetical protein